MPPKCICNEFMKLKLWCFSASLTQDTGEIHGWKVCKQRENLGQSFHQQNKMSSDYEVQMPNEAFFSLKSRNFGLGQTNWTNKFWGILGIFGQSISIHFLVHVFHYSTIISTKKLHLYLFIWDCDLNLDRKELGI